MIGSQVFQKVAPLMAVIGLGTLLSACNADSSAATKTVAANVNKQPATATAAAQTSTATPTAQTSATTVQQAATTAPSASSQTTTAPTTAMNMGRVSISWVPPTENTDGSSLGNLAGYRVYYGPSPTGMTQTVQLTNPGLSAYVLENLSAGTTYFAIASYNAAGVESSLSGVASKTIS